MMHHPHERYRRHIAAKAPDGGQHHGKSASTHQTIAGSRLEDQDRMSHLICRYAQDSTQDAGQPGAAGAGNDSEPTRPQSNSTDNRPEEIHTGGSSFNDTNADQEALQSPQAQRSGIGAAPYFQAICSAPTNTLVPLHLNDSIETPHGDHLNKPIEQRLPSLDSAFSASPLSLSQTSLLNISPFEWYDLVARDAISHIQRLNNASSGDPRWNFNEIDLSRRQSPAPSPDFPQLCPPWNTPSRIELSPIDLTFFRYYIEVVGPILDLFDPARHFSNVVPHLALGNTGLLKSILAVGAKHMSLGLLQTPDGDALGGDATLNSNTPRSLAATGVSESETAPSHMATQYYYETLHYLSQTLFYPAYADSHEILATAIMISTYEMFDTDAASNGGVWEQHLRGSFWILRSQDNDGESVDGMRQAVWWAWLRQDIWAAFQAGRPTITFWRARKTLEQLNSDELATRIIYICSKCVKYAASYEILPSQDPRDRIEQGDRLLRALEDWHNILPTSYQPVTVATNTGSNSMFPPVWIHPPNHAGAMQMYHFARVTVLLNQPTMGGLNTYLLREKQLTESVKMVCSIANSCQENESAMAFVNVQALFGGKYLPLRCLP
ncbi:hypothetical protein TCE0_034f11148 [Talaromyces pinophilus]|uniref:Uncharacterized protein n=1 Tax=Talaromyces pinophilus TaxID=128442 RepID=A0A6V8HLQ8_TALPI|nr:hypothetical protein TCE0_034f11148 [Talaromyces pinophilus]